MAEEMAPGTYNTPQGITAALLSPVAMVIGFFIWEGAWKGSGFGLNVFKGSLASMIFIFTISMQGGFHRILTASRESLSFLILSSLLGIVIGDSAWLEALRIIGARRVIVIDSIKPGLGAMLGTFLLGEPYGWNTVVGLLMSSIGILLVCLEDAKGDEGDDDEQKKQEKKPGTKGDMSQNDDAKKGNDNSLLMRGFSFAVVNVIFDAYGAVLTKQYGLEESFNTFEINLVRFGFASLCLLCIMAAGNVVHLATKGSHSKEDEVGFIELSTVEDSDVENLDKVDAEADGELEDGSDNITDDNDDIISTSATFPVAEKKWFQIPDMSSRDWCFVASGVFCVTYIANSLSNFALLETEMSVCLTLTSIGPIISLPVGYLIKDEPITLRAIAGSTCAVAGIALLTLY